MIKLIILLSGVCFSIVAQNIVIKGKVIDSKTSLPLYNANIILLGDTPTGTFSDPDGLFIISGITNIQNIIEVSYLGYEKKQLSVESFTDSTEIKIIRLNPLVLSTQSILVESFRNREKISPINYTSFDKQHIEDNYTLQDIPEFLASSPSTMFYSESGNGIGYNYLSIRGFDQRRISVSINGIPQNDPEDHNIYWLDFPDLISSAELIQVQRGSSSSMIGYPAIGGAVNIITSSFAHKSKLEFQVSLGSYNTRKYGLSFSSGLINEKYSFYGKLSQILSSGYRDKSWVKFNSYYFSSARYDEKLTTQINLYGGPISDGLAYYGLPKFAMKDKQLRRKNYSYWESDEVKKEITYKSERRAEEIENFSQPHFELLNDYKINDRLSLNSVLFLIIGEGFFDYDGSWADTSYLRLTNENGFYPVDNPQNVLIRAQVENTQFGWIPKLNLAHENGNLVIGAEFRKHNSNHWGSISYGVNLPPGTTKSYRYYFYNASKDIFNAFLNENYKINEKFTLSAEIQLAYHKYHLFNEKYIGTEFKIDNLFVNSKASINYSFGSGSMINFSLARVSREPRLKNYYDAAESSGGEVPQFYEKKSGGYDFSNPYVQPETMNNLEFGLYFSGEKFSYAFNLFYMDFEDEIVKSGKLDRFGQPITGNMKSTLHQGVELSFMFKPSEELEIIGNSTLSRNIIKEGKYYLNDITSLDLSDNRIGGFPALLFNLLINFKIDDLHLKLTGKYVGKFFSDNFDTKITEYLNINPGFIDYIDNVNDSYFTADLFASYNFNLFSALTSSRIFFQANNIFNKLYSAYAIGREFFPAAERNILAGVQIGL
ncbi:MAG: TonB-dependent receptor [Ignavibacteriaceae bacterium]|nr:TonB-dependent receptor [Ignavibacteriaceae bacterium]